MSSPECFARRQITPEWEDGQLRPGWYSAIPITILRRDECIQTLADAKTAGVSGFVPEGSLPDSRP